MVHTGTTIKNYLFYFHFLLDDHSGKKRGCLQFIARVFEPWTATRSQKFLFFVYFHPTNELCSSCFSIYVTDKKSIISAKEENILTSDCRPWFRNVCAYKYSLHKAAYWVFNNVNSVYIFVFCDISFFCSNLRHDNFYCAYMYYTWGSLENIPLPQPWPVMFCQYQEDHITTLLYRDNAMKQIGMSEYSWKRFYELHCSLKQLLSLSLWRHNRR